jgi:hypothetical protein
MSTPPTQMLAGECKTNNNYLYNYSSTYVLAPLFEEQESIRWTNFLKGRLMTQWALHQNRHLKDRSLHNAKTNGTTLATNLLYEWLSLWKLKRNKDRHG